MSDTDTAQGQQAGDSASQQPADTGEQFTQQPTQQPTQTAEESLYSQYLSGIEDEVQRKLMEPHARRWDGMVTKKFQEIHNQYKPFKESGLTADSVAQAAQLYQMLQAEPQRVFISLAQALGYDHLLQPQQQQVQPQGVPNQQVPLGSQAPQYQQQPYEDLDPALAQHLQTLDQRYEQQSNLLTQIAQVLVAREKSQRFAQEEAQLDFELNSLRQKYGDFDENYVLTQMYTGMSGEQAVQAYQALLQQVTNHAAQANSQQPSPPFMGGGTAPPQDNFDVKKASDKDIKGTVAALIRATQQA